MDHLQSSRQIRSAVCAFSIWFTICSVACFSICSAPFIHTCNSVQRQRRQSRTLGQHGHAPLRLLQTDFLQQSFISGQQVSEAHTGHSIRLGKRADDHKIGVCGQKAAHRTRLLTGHELQIAFVHDQIDPCSAAFLRDPLQKIFPNAVSDRIIGIAYEQDRSPRKRFYVFQDVLCDPEPVFPFQLPEDRFCPGCQRSSLISLVGRHRDQDLGRPDRLYGRLQKLRGTVSAQDICFRYAESFCQRSSQFSAVRIRITCKEIQHVPKRTPHLFRRSQRIQVHREIQLYPSVCINISAMLHVLPPVTL